MLAFCTNSIFPKQANIWTVFWVTVAFPNPQNFHLLAKAFAGIQALPDYDGESQGLVLAEGLQWLKKLPQYLPII